MKINTYLNLMLVFALASILVGRTNADEAQDKAAVVEMVESYVNSFNGRDAQAVSEHWSETGELVDPDGNRLTGRAAIRESFETLFKDLSSEQLFNVTVERVSFVTPDVAIVEGIARDVDGQDSSIAVTVKSENGQWSVHSVRQVEIPPRSSHYDQLKELEWMIGQWLDQSEGSTAETTYNWSKNKNFIRSNFKVSVPGMDPLEGTQVIGFDASTSNIRSWVFDSDGGTATGVWTRKGDTWEVRSSQVLADGRIASAINIYKLIDDDQFAWRSIGRQVDGEYLPNTEPVTVYRIVEGTNK